MDGREFGTASIDPLRGSGIQRPSPHQGWREQAGAIPGTSLLGRRPPHSVQEGSLADGTTVLQVTFAAKDER
jgi:hypothetical protein